MYKNLVVKIGGIAIILFSLSADLLGLGNEQGFGLAQLAGVLFGLATIGYGLYQKYISGKPAEKRLTSSFQRIFSFRHIGLALALAGLVMTLGSLAADYLGLGDHSGINITQLKVILLGLICTGFGLWLWRPDHVPSNRKFYRLMRWVMARKTVGVVMIIAGLVLILWMTVIEQFTQGAQPGFGIVQLIGVILGSIGLITGVWITFLYRYINPEKFNPVIQLPGIRRMYVALLILGLGLTGIYLVNNIYSRINLATEDFECINYFDEAANHVGADFRTGIYRPPKAELHHKNIYLTGLSNYPPSTILFFTPLQLFNEDTGYLIVVGLLTLANIGSLLLTTLLVRDLLLARLKLETSSVVTLATALFITILFYTISGYPFMFSIERGNYDSIALFFAMLGVFLMVRKPDSLWWQVICISIATHLKMYPAALFIVLLYKHGRRMIIPSLLVNVIMLFSLGYRNAIWFIEIMIDYTLAPQVWVGNHSGYSFAGFLIQKIPDLAIYSTEIRNLFTILPIFIWVVSCYYAIKNLKPDICTLMLTMVSIPLMCMLPTVSHDYKLVVLHPAILLLVSVFVFMIIRSSRLWDYLLLAFVMGLSLLISRSYKLIADPNWIISNKYPLILLLSIVMLAILYSLKREADFSLKEIH